MRYYYHNHYQEFQPLGEGTVYDFIMEHTDPGLVYAELDTYWAARGGQDPVKLLEKYGDRLILLHQKDFPAGLSEPLCMFDGLVDPQGEIDGEVFQNTKNPLAFTEIGTGILPIQDYIEAALSCPGLEYILLEQDATQMDELDSIRTSMAAFQKFKGVEF